MVRRYIIVIMMALFVALLQTTLLSRFDSFLSLDLFFVIVVIIGMNQDPVHGSIMAMICGYLEDLMAAEVTGLFMTARLVVFFLAQYLRVRLFPQSMFSQFTIGLALGAADKFIVYMLHQVFTKPMDISWRGFAALIMGAIVNAAIVPFFFFIFQKIPGLMEKPGRIRFRE